MQLLAGDIGGTNSRLAIYQTGPDAGLELVTEKDFASAEFDGLEAIIAEFLQQSGAEVERAAFGVPGPVRNGQCTTTKFHWQLSAKSINARFGFAATHLLNDLEANAWGIDRLKDEQMVLLQAGDPDAQGNRSIVSAGTGLGEAGLFWDGHQHIPFATEGGHSDFSPSTPLEFALFEHLTKQHGHVSWERLVCGPGLETIHDFLRQHRKAPAPAWLKQVMREQGSAAAISNAALTKQDEICDQALDLFVRLYGREVGNHALKIMATGGVYLGGGIAPKLIDRLRQGAFIEAFLDKGRMQELMASMPVRIILNQRTALLGVAHFAATMSL
ncbi:glucokinase [endosymbiont of Ridgeia piscesae]|jgi:glucokinase|uniref:Glucokinase n=1 Tax=endosymbiont of Ridgeia piscesae TaxID=54398 RepID=A0A0T5ZBM8_9GAMM|nr:glucokinase [endosymbiont of Ridgeia piscesae]KRT54053.1 glucokinase [endosymbiont of Ridgeia piscesae]KRT60236.1 glucokinase [endosymbiont of Ridgeia piscesae]